MSLEFRGEVGVGHMESGVNSIKMGETTGLGEIAKPLKAKFPQLGKEGGMKQTRDCGTEKGRQLPAWSQAPAQNN